MWVASVASATPTAEAAAAARCFLAEVDVIVDGGIDRVRIERHLRPRQDFPLPGLDAERAAAASAKHDGEQDRNAVHGSDTHSGSPGNLSERVPAGAAAAPMYRDPRVEIRRVALARDPR